jgi:CBS domain-containing protein
VPVVDAAGGLTGIVSADDLLEFLAEEMGDLSRIASHQQAREKRARQ